ncbi:limulus clotting factor C-like isoform X2 [Corticium candelabrum]|uniref:limulus clotting factor C-like isoform X2 n=1 Tax=Corticium candelabrum TaxID=121492 RepID=UPI002E25B27D|nr:limulus clotting factor C-like isoform X2 [Corticium candelabrum]
MHCTVFGWSPRYPPTCIPWCPRLKNPENGVVNQTATYAKYSCNSGYRLEGRSERLCLQGHGWNLYEPKCLKMPPKCSNLTNPAHGLAIMGLGNYSVRYLCNYPYYLHGSENRKCINGNWTDSDPICVLVCPQFLSAPKFGKVDEGVLAATYSCSKGYYLYGQSVRKCDKGKWKGYPPVCIKENCTIPEQLSNGGHYLLAGDTVYYYCHTGYVMEGNHKVVCTNSKWGSFPKCHKY